MFTERTDQAGFSDTSTHINCYNGSMEEEKIFTIKCTPEEIKTVLEWASEGIYDYMGSNGWIVERAGIGDKYLDKITKQIEEQLN